MDEDIGELVAALYESVILAWNDWTEGEERQRGWKIEIGDPGTGRPYYEVTAEMGFGSVTVRDKMLQTALREAIVWADDGVERRAEAQRAADAASEYEIAG